MPVHDYDACVAADVAQGLAVGAGNYVAAVAAHQPELRRSSGGGGGRGVEGLVP